MRALNLYKKVVSSVFKHRVLLEQTGVFRGVSSVPTARCHKQNLPVQFIASLASCHNWSRVFTCHLNTKRCFSELNNNSQECRETESDNPKRSSETFSLDVLVSLLRQENAVDICVIKVPEQIKYTDYFIVVSGVSPRHLRAMALYAIKVYKFLKKGGDPDVKFEGKDAEDWMCIDFGGMVVHFMLPETREVYELEKLWTLRNYDEQLKSIPAETLPEDFIYDGEVTK
ncbi:mitochondrial assembly of ribosomal large subunit protein 1 [Anabas testudineus]|uniref:Mitochondrial assembly of ribosomal large subunit protein 1 n=1 Tax=Anabas testudineus TaxID=64144 RepID=A0A7N5ZUA7_ANATE|nr:mitochondrial assembly of ribosomal large subunit protein 1 [Anabas testudineus]